METNAPLRVLVTNDDGPSSPGLWHLAEALRGPGREVVVVAPERDSSGFAAAVGDIAPGAVIEATPTSWPDAWTGSPAAADVPAWVVAGPPGRCVLAGVLGVFGPRPHVVVSGINAGANVGRFLQLHSGTLGAALTAGNCGLRAMAVSLDVMPTEVSRDGVVPRWDTAASVASELVDQLLTRPRATVWNVNSPNLERARITGIAEARLGRSRNVMAVRPIDERQHEIHLVPANGPVDDDDASDRRLLDDGRVTITAVTIPGLTPVGDVVLGPTTAT